MINNQEEPLAINNNPGPRLNLSSDKSVVAEVREAMTAFRDGQLASKSIGMGCGNYRFIQKLILLEARPFLSRVDRKKIGECFEIIERTRRMKLARAIGEDVIRRNWVGRKKALYVVKTDRRRFDQAVMTIGESCEALTCLTLPDDITKEDVSRTIGSLLRSVELISRLTQRLVGEATEESEDGEI